MRAPSKALSWWIFACISVGWIPSRKKPSRTIQHQPWKEALETTCFDKVLIDYDWLCVYARIKIMTYIYIYLTYIIYSCLFYNSITFMEVSYPFLSYHWPWLQSHISRIHDASVESLNEVPAPCRSELTNAVKFKKFQLISMEPFSFGCWWYMNFIQLTLGYFRIFWLHHNFLCGRPLRHCCCCCCCCCCWLGGIVAWQTVARKRYRSWWPKPQPQQQQHKLDPTGEWRQRSANDHKWPHIQASSKQHTPPHPSIKKILTLAATALAYAFGAQGTTILSRFATKSLVAKKDSTHTKRLVLM